MDNEKDRKPLNVQSITGQGQPSGLPDALRHANTTQKQKSRIGQVQLSAYVDEELKHAFKLCALERRINIQDALREAVIAYIDQHSEGVNR